MNCKTIMLLAALGVSVLHAGEGERMARYVEREAASMQEPASSPTSIARKLAQTEEEGGSEALCAAAARFGRLLKYLPQSKGPINKDKLEKKCGDYFLGKNDTHKMHPHAYAAIVNFPANEKNIELWARERAREQGIITRTGPGHYEYNY